MLLPTRSRPEGARLIGVPDIVRPGPPAKSVVPATLKAEGLGAKVCPATVKTTAGFGIGLPLPGFSLPPIPWLESPLWPFSGVIKTFPDGASDKMLFPTVIGSPPTESLVPPTAMIEGSETVIVWPATLMIDESTAAGCAWTVLVPTMSPDVPIENEVPAISTAGPPGAMVVPPIDIAEEGSAVYVDPSTTKIGFAERGVGSNRVLLKTFGAG